MPTGTLVDPFINFAFLVEIDGIRRAGFHECNGINSSIDVIEHNEGGTVTPIKIPGLTKFGEITLKWGKADDTDLYDWHMQVATGGQTIRKNGSIVVLDRAGNEVSRWNFIRAWPSKWNGPDFNAEGNDVAIETLVLTHEGLSRG
jgi:phage tail-like protein